MKAKGTIMRAPTFVKARQARLLPLASLCLGLATLGATAAAEAQDWKGKGRIDGLVTDEQENPLMGATVTLTLKGAGPESLTTNKKGRWSYLGMTGGQWDIKAEMQGFIPYEGRLFVTEFGRNQPSRVLLESVDAARAANAEAAKTAAANKKDAATKDAARTATATDQLSNAGRLAEQGKHAEARALMEESLVSLEPSKHATVLLAMAKTHVQEDNVDQAVATLERGLALNPQHVESLKLIASVLVNAGREGEAQPYLDRLPEGQQIDPSALLNIGIKKYNENDLDGALSEFDRVAADYPSLPDVYYYRGLVHLGKANNTEAIADFEKLLELDSSHANAGEAEQFLEYLKSQ